MNFVLGFLYALAAQILTFFQLQGQFKYEWAKENPFYMSLLGIPLSLLYIQSVKYLVIHFELLAPISIDGGGSSKLVIVERI